MKKLKLFTAIALVLSIIQLFATPQIVLQDEAAQFEMVTETFNSINVIESSAPTFTDLDGDGLLDLLVGNGNGYGVIYHYEQDSENSMSFTFVTDSFNSIDVGNRSAPTFTDLDGDGLLDLLIGENDGNINHYEQDAENSTGFTFVTSMFNSIDIGRYSKPTFTDIDNDCLLDLLVGEESGNLNHYEQDSENSMSFTFVTNSFNSIDVGILSAPAFTDLDSDGLLDLIVGNGDGDGVIYHYEQDSENSMSFTFVTNSFNSAGAEWESAPTFTDLDGDGLLDYIFGEYSANLNHFEQVGIEPFYCGDILIGNKVTRDYY
ncbi:MAG: FG-GAP-like repeat-containing protein [Candidatus Cloacimonetes bacterium]|nr:FG-GAP-like repeat-containing protein [Candidatus Cloacimonadota bacterium]